MYSPFCMNMSMRKPYSNWVLHLHIVNQKQQHVNSSEHCLQLFQCNKKEFLCKYVTMDKTWIYHSTPLQSQIGGQQQLKAVQSDQTQRSAGKVLASIFLDVEGILLIDYLKKGRTINSEYYIALLVHLKEEIAKNSQK